MARLLLAALALAILATPRLRWWLADVLTDTAIALAPPIPREYAMTDEQAERGWARVDWAAEIARGAARAPVRDD